MKLGFSLSSLAVAFLFVMSTMSLVLPRPLQAQAAQQPEPKPVVTFCVAPLDRSLPDLVFVLSAMNVPEVSGVVELLSNFYTKGLDRTKPLGMIVTLEDDTPNVLFCVPTTDPQQWFQALGSMGLEPEDLGDGLFELAVANQFLIARSVNNWLFLAQSEEAVQAVPGDPEQLFGDLPSRYNMSMRIDLEQVSPESRKTLLEEMKLGLERNVAEQFGDQLGDQLDIARESSEQLEELEELINEVQQVVIGVLVDSKQKQLYLDGAVQFMPESKMAQQMDSQANLRSNFAQVRLPESVLDFRMTYTITTEQDKVTAKESLASSLEQAQQAIARSGLPLDRSRLIKEFLSSSAKIAEKTIDEGDIDAAFSLSYENEIVRALMAARVADGKAIESEIKDFLKGLSQTAELELDFDLENYKNWSLHRVRAKLPASEQGMSDLLGEQVELFIAGSDSMVIASLDPDGYQALKSSIDQVDLAGSSKVTPIEMTVQMARVIPLLLKLNPDSTIENLEEALEQLGSEDQVKVTATMLPRGMVVRIGFDAGLLRLVGKLAQSGNLVPGF
jgi:hypothetical protein